MIADCKPIPAPPPPPRRALQPELRRAVEHAVGHSRAARDFQGDRANKQLLAALQGERDLMCVQGGRAGAGAGYAAAAQHAWYAIAVGAAPLAACTLCCTGSACNAPHPIPCVAHAARYTAPDAGPT